MCIHEVCFCSKADHVPGQSEGQVYEEGLIGELVGAGDGGMLDVPYEEQGEFVW